MAEFNSKSSASFIRKVSQPTINTQAEGWELMIASGAQCEKTARLDDATEGRGTYNV